MKYTLLALISGVALGNTLPPTWQNTLPPTWENTLPPTWELSQD